MFEIELRAYFRDGKTQCTIIAEVRESRAKGVPVSERCDFNSAHCDDIIFIVFAGAFSPETRGSRAVPEISNFKYRRY